MGELRNVEQCDRIDCFIFKWWTATRNNVIKNNNETSQRRPILVRNVLIILFLLPHISTVNFLVVKFQNINIIEYIIN